MSQVKGLWKISKSWTQNFGARRTTRQQWQQADDTELRKLASSTSGFSQDTSYRPQSMDNDVAFKDDVSSKTSPEKSRRWTSGWRFGAINCAISASVVFTINLVVTIWGSVHNKSKGSVLFEGDCEEARKLNTGIHFLINLLSTILLSSSNYCMQCLSAPTRREVDEAHAQQIWLDIGVPSIHNLRRINRRRAILWGLLGLSSLPLHLFYNSTVFSSLSSNNYWAHSVSESFLSDDTCFNCDNITATSSFGVGTNSSSYSVGTSDYGREVIKVMYEKARKGELERLSNADCIREYGQMIQSTRRNVLLVAADDKYPPRELYAIGASHVYAANQIDATDASDPREAVSIYNWICSGPSHRDEMYGNRPCVMNIEGVKKDPDHWNVSGEYYDYVARGDALADTANYGYPVEYCLSERAEPHCKLQFTLPIAILVTILNLIKAVLIFYTAFGTKEDPLMTMGDAVASFLERRDPTTKGMCLLSRSDVKKQKGYFPAGPKEWTGKKRRWKDVTSHLRRFVTISMFSIIIITVGSLYGFGIRHLPDGTSKTLVGVAKLGYGAIDARTIISFDQELTTIQNVLVANIAQPILSFLYFSYNGLFTCMLLGFEWTSYAYRRKGLRVSRVPSGSQRSTYFLQLPYRFALPLMALSGVLHWLVSQSIFLVAIDVYDWDGSRPWDAPDADASTKLDGDWKSCGYSPIAIWTTLMVGIFMTLAIIGFGFIPFKPGMNLAGSNSAAISAACHPGDGDEVEGFIAAREKLKWGVVSTGVDGVGHCTFSTKEVDMPRVGQMYAG